MAWATPKTDWATTDGIATTDLNRMEANALYLLSTEGSFTLNILATDFSPAVSALTVYYRTIRISDAIRAVDLVFPALSGSSNTDQLRVTDDSIPAALRPTSTVYVPCIVTSNGAIAAGAFWAYSTGDCQWSVGVDSTGFSATGTKGFPSFCVRYSLL